MGTDVVQAASTLLKVPGKGVPGVQQTPPDPAGVAPPSPSQLPTRIVTELWKGWDGSSFGDSNPQKCLKKGWLLTCSWSTLLAISREDVDVKRSA